jgi:hypothetical protein
VKFFLENFNWAVFENEIKWGWTEPERGKVKFVPPQLFLFLEQQFVLRCVSKVRRVCTCQVVSIFHVLTHY